MTLRQIGLLCLSNFFLLFLLTSTVTAYPDKPVQIITPVQAASGTDIIARHLAEALKNKYNQTFIVVNKPGASTTLGSRHFIDNTKSDGHTIFFAAQSAISSLTSAENIKFKEFDSKIMLIAVVNETPQVLLVNPEKYKSLQDLKNASNVKFALISNGGLGQISSEMLRPDGIPISYKGNPDALLGLLRKEVDFFSAPINGAIGQIESGKLLVLGRFTSDVTGFKNWTGVFVKKDTPKEIVESLKKTIEEIKLDKNFLNKEPSNIILPNLSFTELSLFLSDEYKRYEKAHATLQSR